MQKNYALIENGIVVNTVLWDGETDWSPPDGQSAVQSDTAGVGWTYSGDVFTPPVAPTPPAPTLAQAQAAQVAVLHAACAAAITGGFQSAALGSSYAYPSDLTSQGNQSTVASSPSGGALWAQPAGGVWELMPHSQAQAQAVVASFVAFLNANQQQLATYTANVNSAVTPDAASAVVWEAI